MDLQTLNSQYREIIGFYKVNLENPEISGYISSAMVPHPISGGERNQVIKEISIIGCNLTDEGFSKLMKELMTNKNA